MSNEKSLLETAELAINIAKKHGASDVAATVSRSRDVDVTWRDGKLDRIAEATTRSLWLQLYVDHRYSGVSTCDLRPSALEAFIADSVALARSLEVDPHRALPDPETYAGRSTADLELNDPAQKSLSSDERRELARALEEATRAVKPASAIPIVSVETSVGDGHVELVRVHTNGFSGTAERTSFYCGASITVQDADGRRPEESAYASTRHRAALPAAAELGREAAERAFARVGAKKSESATCNLVVDHRAAGRLLSFLLEPLSARSLQQRRSCFEGKLGTAVGSPLLDIADDPLVSRGLGSRHFDGEGMTARPFPLFAAGVLSSYYVDTYYGRKTSMKPTTAGPSNHAWKLGAKDQMQLIADGEEGFFVTSFLGGNSNSTTGDFSLGLQGFRIRGGLLAEPIAEMNLSGNHLSFWKQLAGVGNDPYPYSSLRTPTLLFEGAQVAGV